MDNVDVPPALQATISAVGIHTLVVFAKIEEYVHAFRNFVKTDLTMDLGTGIHNKVATAKLLNAWETAQVRGRKRREDEAMQKKWRPSAEASPYCTSRSPACFLVCPLRAAQEAHSTPDYLEARLQQMEDGELVTEKMSDIADLEDDTGFQDLGIKLQPDGKISAARTSTKKGFVPKDSEEFRQKIQIMAHAWELIRLKLPGKPYLQNFSIKLFEDYADYILGDSVAKLAIEAQGAFKVRPSWHLVVDFDFAFRERVSWAFDNRHGTFKDFFKFAYDDANTYQTKFLTPHALHSGVAAVRASFSSLFDVVCRGGCTRVQRWQKRLQRKTRQSAESTVRCEDVISGLLEVSERNLQRQCLQAQAHLLFLWVFDSRRLPLSRKEPGWDKGAREQALTILGQSSTE